MWGLTRSSWSDTPVFVLSQSVRSEEGDSIRDVSVKVMDEIILVVSIIKVVTISESSSSS